ncbi:RNA polymerase sigma factor SigJ [Parasphingorhabdus pacifica]
MSSDEDLLTYGFEAHRDHLLAVAYRLTGGLADAEDAVQEAWLRLSGLSESARSEIREPAAWLTTVIGRICLDRVRSAAARREQYVGTWLPEPIVTSPDGQDPLDAVLSREDMRLAAVRVLDELSPDQRLSFVLHDGFEVPFSEIADILDCSVAAARQHASRARRAVADDVPPPRVPRPEHQELLEAFLAALASRDVDAITRALHPRVTVYGDGGGRARTARRPVAGRDKVARFALGLLSKYGDDLFRGSRPVLVNGDPGVFVPGTPEGTPARFAVAPSVAVFSVRDGLPAEFFHIANPDKLTRMRD